MRRFEFKNATSSKYWQITLAGDAHTVHFGKLL